MIGKLIGRYRVVEKLGEGGMGVVYRAEDTELQRPVALKFFTRAAAGGDLRAQMLNEGRAAASLDHPNICPVYDVGESDGHLFLAMAYIEGETLASRIERGPMPAREAAAMLRQIASGLGAAHAKDIVHRDIKSSNILIAKDGLAKITDFGIAGPSKPTEGALTFPPRAPPPTCRRNRHGATRPTSAATSGPSACCSTRC